LWRRFHSFWPVTSTTFENLLNRQAEGAQRNYRVAQPRALKKIRKV